MEMDSSDTLTWLPPKKYSTQNFYTHPEKNQFFNEKIICVPFKEPTWYSHLAHLKKEI